MVVLVLSVCNTAALWPNDCVDQDATWYAVGRGSGDIVLHGNSDPPCRKGHSRPHFSAHVYCAQTVHTVAHLSKC